MDRRDVGNRAGMRGNAGRTGDVTAPTLIERSAADHHGLWLSAEGGLDGKRHWNERDVEFRRVRTGISSSVDACECHGVHCRLVGHVAELEQQLQPSDRDERGELCARGQDGRTRGTCWAQSRDYRCPGSGKRE